MGNRPSHQRKKKRKGRERERGRGRERGKEKEKQKIRKEERKMFFLNSQLQIFDTVLRFSQLESGVHCLSIIQPLETR
jgi:hypothetical protein